MKYLKLSFRNAGFYTVNKNTKDFMFDINGQHKRKDVLYGKQQKVSISVNQISNMLHVLMGERPSATYRDTLINPINSIFQTANKSYIKIYTSFFINKNKNVKYYPSESVTIRKSVWNSFNPAPDLVYWKRVENFLTNDIDNSLYLEFVKILNSILEYDVLKKTFLDVIDELIKNHKNHSLINTFKLKLKESMKVPMIKILDGEYDGTMNKNSRTMLTTNFGVDKITRLSGSIIIPVEEYDIEKIRNSKGSVTLLDGGVVWIEDLINDYEFGVRELEEYLPINKLEEYENNI